MAKKHYEDMVPTPILPSKDGEVILTSNLAINNNNNTITGHYHTLFLGPKAKD